MAKTDSADNQLTVDTKAKPVEVVLEGEELDKALYDVMNTLWKAYRESVIQKSYKTFNGCFDVLYGKYTDRGVVRFIEGMGMGLVNALNRRINNE